MASTDLSPLGLFAVRITLSRMPGCWVEPVNRRPGEVSLAHNGVLFLDELPEFHRSTLEVMRQPLEDGKVTISRAAGSLTFPSEFMLVAAMNPCPCGHYGDLRRECRCAPAQVQKYRNRLSGPLMDRIDIHVEVPAMELKDMTGTPWRNPPLPSGTELPGLASCN